MSSIKSIVVLLVILYIIYMLIRKKYDLFSAFAFSLPFVGININIGLSLYIYQIIILLTIGWGFIYLFQYKKRNIFLFKNSLISLYIIYAILITMIMPVYFTPSFVQTGSYLRQEGRFIGQLIVLLLTFSLIPIAINYVKTKEDIVKYLKFFLDALIILTILGWIQYFIYNATGIDILPIDIRADGTARSGIDNTLGSLFFRMSSLGGEPKGFAVSLTLGIFIIQIFNHYKIYFYKNDKLIKYIFFITMLMTLSTSGFVLFAIMLLVYKIFTIKKLKSKISSKTLFYSLLSITILGYIIYYFWDTIYLILESRIFERNLTGEDYDYPIQKFLSLNKEYLLFGLGLGNAHNFAAQYILPENLFYMQNNIFIAKSGYLRLLSEVGIIGSIIFLLINFELYYKYKIIICNKNLTEKHILQALILFLILCMIGYFARAYLLYPYIFTLSIVNAYIYNQKYSN